MTSLTKKLHPPRQNFFQVLSTRLADPFEPLNSSSAISGEARALVRQPKIAVFYAEIEVGIYCRPALNVLRHLD